MLERRSLMATVYTASVAAEAAAGMEGRAEEWTWWMERLCGGMEARKALLEVRARMWGASVASGLVVVCVERSEGE